MSKNSNVNNNDFFNKIIYRRITLIILIYTAMLLKPPTVNILEN
jgi:hypothetical protein